VVTLAFARVASAQGEGGRAAGDTFGDTGPGPFDQLVAEVRLMLCPYIKLICVIAAAIAVLRALHMMFKAARGGESKHWITALVLLLVAGFLIEPWGWLDLFGLSGSLPTEFIDCPGAVRGVGVRLQSAQHVLAHAGTVVNRIVG
jgi:hypothetical protein